MLLLDARLICVFVHRLEKVFYELIRTRISSAGGWRDISGSTYAILPTVILFGRLAFVAPAELGELVIGLEGGAKLERIFDSLVARCSLDGVEVLLEIGYRCVGMLAGGSVRLEGGWETGAESD